MNLLTTSEDENDPAVMLTLVDDVFSLGAARVPIRLMKLVIAPRWVPSVSTTQPTSTAPAWPGVPCTARYSPASPPARAALKAWETPSMLTVPDAADPDQRAVPIRAPRRLASAA